MSRVEEQEAVTRLYAVPPEAFIALRSELVAQAKAADDRALSSRIGGLRKPSAAAWAVNLMVRERPGEVAALLDLGGRLRRAQARGAGDQLRELGRERTRILGETTEMAAAAAASRGHPLSPAARRELAETLTAAVSSAAAAEAVASGALTRALSYAGLGEVDVSGATAGRLTLVRGGDPNSTTPATRQAKTAAAGRAATQRMAKAERSARLAAAALAAAEAELGEVTARLDAAATRVEDLEGQLERAREELLRLTTEHGRAGRAHRDAEQAVRVAIVELDAARG
ncbi:MAG TPA: hypothetical protein VFJ97_15445 [Dermatophilaceae bacterium]|nr:hypothetical protein [Dermatophilaceae bacterium]